MNAPRIRADSPDALKALPAEEIPALCEELRAEILDAVAQCGGHLASNLGVVELSVALHRVFDSPIDTLIFDVGHQCYAHKMLTGRLERFTTLRQPGGLSGFPSREESDHDPFTTGHSGSSLSSALGIAEANRIAGRDAWAVAIIGDGSFTNGMVYEALNGCARRGLKLMIVLNDNEMSISKNVGALSEHFARIRTSQSYFRFKRTVKSLCTHIPLLGRPLISLAIKIKEFIKRSLNQKNLFESLGLEYLGPVCGEDASAIEAALTEAKDCDVPCIVHVITKKGKGYLPAEEDPSHYHGVSPFDLRRGIPDAPHKETFSSTFGDVLTQMAREDATICAVTAAMPDGTGLTPFAAAHPDRFFDVGIAEEHAVTMAAGLSRGGMTSVLSLYSTFAQRTVDQLIHDVALQHLPFTLCLDRAGTVPGDGVTHQGIFDVPLLLTIPGVTLYAPESYGELAAMLRRSVREEGLSVIRYPRGREADYDRAVWRTDGDIGYADVGHAPKRAIITYGRMAVSVLQEADAHPESPTRVIRLARLLPLPKEELTRALEGIQEITVREESMIRGGLGEHIAAWRSQVKVEGFTDFVGL